MQVKRMKTGNFAVVYRDAQVDIAEYFTLINRTMTADDQERGMIELVKRFDGITMEQAAMIEGLVSVYTGPKEGLIENITDALK